MSGVVVTNIFLKGLDNPELTSVKTMFFPHYFEATRNFVLMKLGISADHNKVVVGQSQWLYLGNKYESVINNHRGIFNHDNDAIDKWAKTIANNQKVFKQLGADSLFFIAPNKHSIYSELLPAGMDSDHNQLTTKLLEKASTIDVNVAYMDAQLKAHRNSEDHRPVYYKGDSHWNQIGAFLAYADAIELINQHFNRQLQAVATPTFSPLAVVAQGRAGTARLLKVESFIDSDYDINYHMQFEGRGESVCMRFIKLNGEPETPDCEAYANDQEILYTNKVQQFDNPKAINQAKVLWLRDSFGAAPSPLMVKTFSTLYSAHYYWLSGAKLIDFIKQYQPDLVIFQVVERNVFHNRLLLTY